MQLLHSSLNWSRSLLKSHQVLFTFLAYNLYPTALSSSFRDFWVII